MKTSRTVSVGLAIFTMVALVRHSGKGAEQAPHIASFAVPQAGDVRIIFHAGPGPFRLQMKTSGDPSAPWVDADEAIVTEIQPGVYMALCPKGLADLAFYRVVSESESMTDLKGWTITVKVSAPANGLYLVPGESAVVTVTILDTLGRTVTREALSALGLYLYGPQDPKRTVAAVKLLNASANRADNPHHYINLKNNPGVTVSGNTLTYPLRPVTDEQPGTYTVSVRASLASDPLQQIMKFAGLQIGTGDVEHPVVARVNCAACHEGTISGKMYLHHIDPSGTSKGNWSLDYEPVRSCKSCHNNEGYSAYRDSSAPGGRVVDPIIRRVHGVHMGRQLKLPFNIDPEAGDFRDYIHVGFPADVRNCTVCHADDRWKTEPTRLACGTCHDDIWFGPFSELPGDMKPHDGGYQKDDAKCGICHGPEDVSTSDSLAMSVPEAHRVPPPAFKNVVQLELTPPANARFYVAGEAPRATIKITDAATGQPINPSTIVEPVVSTNVQPNEWRRANLFVSGPRMETEPVLTTAAATSVSTYANNDFRVRLDPTNEDPRITRTVDAILYQLDDVQDLEPGTYTAFAQVQPSLGLGGWAYVNFQVGQTNVEAMVASNCTDCHRDTRMHASSMALTFTPDICKNCHDYKRQIAGRVGWTSSNNGFGAAPLARRVHGVHFGNYVEKPEEIHRNYVEEFGHIIFPQDVRNCTKCHSQSTSWTEKPSRLACLACHDSPAATFHGLLMTFDPTPLDSWSGDEIETCSVCHGKDTAFSPKIVHSIANPYVPPYPRALRGE